MKDGFFSLALATTQGKDIVVFRFIIEYIVASGIFIGPYVKIIIIGLFLYKDF